MYRSAKKKMVRRLGLCSVVAMTALGVGITVVAASPDHQVGTHSVATKAFAEPPEASKVGAEHSSAARVTGTTRPSGLMAASRATSTKAPVVGYLDDSRASVSPNGDY